MERKYEKKNVDYDDEFLRRFAAEIGTALRERDDGNAEPQRQNQPSITESVEDLYRSLVFDEPLIDHIPNLPVVVSALSRQLLLSSSSSYAFSNRLINGIIYFCNQDTKRSTKENEKNAHNDTFGHSTTKTAMAKLAFCVLIDTPLECIRGENSSSEGNMKKNRNLLGSFKGSMQDKNQERKSNSAKIDDDSLSNKIYGDKFIGSDFVEKHDEICSLASDKDGNNAAEIQSIGEVSAVESDPSDFDYGEVTSTDLMARETTIEFPQEHPENDWLDPKILSRPDPKLTLQQTRNAIGTLLQHASYTLLEPIFCLPQKDTSLYVSQLTQLVLTILKPGSYILDRSMDYVMLSPLWILRDAAAYHTNNNSTMRQSCTSNYVLTYLEILQTLLAVDQAYLQDVGSLANSTKSTTNPDFDLCVASIVGMSALASWCSMQKKYTQSTVDAIVDSMNDLSHVAERAKQSYKENLPNTLIPILEILSGIYYDHVDKQSSALVPQTLMNSGFLRQILALVTDEASTGDLGLHHALWGLCIAFPRIVGKYVFRYPGFSQISRSYATKLDSLEPQICVQCILWSIYGWYQCKESSLASGVNIVWKNGPLSGDKCLKNSPLTQDECSEVCTKAWSQLCNSVKNALEAYNGSDDIGAERIIQEWGRLLVLSRIPSIATIFKNLIDSSLLGDISIVISNQSERDDGKPPDKSCEDKKANDKKDDKPSRRPRNISQARKVLKEYKLFFLGTAVGTSKTD